MFEIGGQNILLGGFHDHWSRNGSDNPSLLLAAMTHYHYDFICLMDGTPAEARVKECAEAYNPDTLIHLGCERFFGWGHVVTVGSCTPCLPADDPDFRSVLCRLTAESDFVALAHPSYPGTWQTIVEPGHLDALLDDNCMHAVQFCCSPPEIEWLAQRKREGKCTPIVGGWDAHLLNPVRDLPPVLYGRYRIPDGHIDSCGNNRTIVLAEDNSLPAVVAAVSAGQSVVENLATGDLFGDAETVAFLEANDYRRAIAELNAVRDAMTLAPDRSAVAGEPLELQFSSPGLVRLPGTLEKPEARTTDAQGRLHVKHVPALLDRDWTHFPVVTMDGRGRPFVWAVEVQHSIQLDVLPLIEGVQPAVELRPRRPFRGTARLAIEDVLPGGADVPADRLTVDLPDNAWPKHPLPYRLECLSGTGVSRVDEGLLTFVRAPRFESEGADMSVVAIDRSECAPTPGTSYGASRPWPGPDTFSATFHFAWTVEHFLVRARVTDAVHYQPFRGHFMYNADSLQIGLDPLLRRGDTAGSLYVFNVALTPEGPEVFRWQTPYEEASPEFTPPQGNRSLGDTYLSVTSWEKGLVYDLALPWSELAPIAPGIGTRMGLYIILFNNDGNGLVDTLHWPRPIEGMWLIPRKWGVLTLTR